MKSILNKIKRQALDLAENIFNVHNRQSIYIHNI